MKFRVALLLLPVLGVATVSASVAFDFSSFGSALISFQGTGDTLRFSHDATGFDFRIANATDTRLNGMFGRIDGSFNVGPITIAGPLQEAPISGTGVLTIAAGTGPAFTATIGWNSALTLGATGAMNPYGQINLGNFAYSGPNAALQSLAGNTFGASTVSFQFLPSTSLTQLTADGSLRSTTFSGSFSAGAPTAVPEPGTYAMLVGAAALLGALYRRRSARAVQAA